MNEITAVEYLSLDGAMDDPGPMGDFAHRGWTMPYWNDQIAKAQTDTLFANDALLLGRVTYDEFVASWPQRSGDPFTERINSMPKYVASKSLKKPLTWNSTLLKGDVVKAVRALKEEPGNGLLIYGSAALVDTLLRHDLIDTYQLILYPIILGSGTPYFKRAERTKTFTLVNAEPTSSGVVMLTYRPERPAG